MVNRGHFTEDLKQLFTEVSKSLGREHVEIDPVQVSKIAQYLKLVDETKFTKKIMLLHQEHHPKDVSRCTL